MFSVLATIFSGAVWDVTKERANGTLIFSDDLWALDLQGGGEQIVFGAERLLQHQRSFDLRPFWKVAVGLLDEAFKLAL